MNNDDEKAVKEVHYHDDDHRHERSRGMGWLTTVLALLLIAVILWATGILDIDLSGDTQDETLQGGGTFELGPPDDNSPPADSNFDLNPNENLNLR